MTEPLVTRRQLATGAGALILASQLSSTPARAAAKYTRYSITSANGQKMLASYAKGIEAMLKRPADDPRNWFRNAFIHLMDCPHGNWWFYVWHRGYLGYFEQTIRELSGDSEFALPYWDWTKLPQIPDSMFNGVLTPADQAFAPYTRNLAVFTSFIKPTLSKYFDQLSKAQRAQLSIRGYTIFDNLWNDVTGYTAAINPPGGISGNMAYANTCGSRYLTRDNPKFDQETTDDVSELIIAGGLSPTEFNSAAVSNSFTSSKTGSHNVGGDAFSTLEGTPHNNVHNYIGGVGYLDPGPYGNMTNFLSPVDPIFFMHHANMDRLWDVWTRKQQAAKLPYLPTKASDLKALSDEPFLFYVDSKGNYVPNGKAGDYLSMERFEYDYEPGSGDDAAPAPAQVARRVPIGKVAGKGNTASIPIPNEKIEGLLNKPRPAMLEVTVPAPGPVATVRSFKVLVNAPANVTNAGADSPYYAGRIAFFGAMTQHKMDHDVTFVLPLPPRRELFTAPGPQGAAKKAATGAQTLNVRLVPAHGQAGPVPVLKSVAIVPG